MVSLTFYGGVGEVGGNKILVEDGQTRLFLDFGKNFAQERRYFDEPYLAPREEKHLLALGILPEIEGIYKKDPREHTLTAVVVSHAHADHIDYVRYLKDDIPIYCSEVTRDVVIAREWSGRSSSKEYEIAGLTQKGERVPKDFRILPPSERTKVGNVEIEGIPVDHSIPGAIGIIVHTTAGAVVYSGDFRRHGRRAAATQEFAEQARAASPVALIIEGTNMVSARLSSENEVEQKVREVVSATPKLIMAGFSNVDTDRISTFYNVARSTGRKLVLSMRQGFLLHRMGPASPFDVCDPDVWVFQREKKTTSEWERRVAAAGCTIVTSQDVRDVQGEVILVASFYDMNETVEIRPGPGSVYILSQSEPFNEEMEIDFEKLVGWLEHYGIPLYNIHASGHAPPHHLKEIIRQIAPKQVFLIHTERPALYRRFLEDLSGPQIICPEPGQCYPL